MNFEFLQCKGCGALRGVELHPNTGLGPALCYCRRCEQAFPTERMEWRDLPGYRRGLYVLFSVAYIAAGYFIGGVSAKGVSHLLSHPDQSQMDLSGPIVLYASIAWGLILFLVQVSRVNRSIRRTSGRAKGEGAAYQGSLFDLQSSGAMKLLIVWLVPPFLAWGIGWLIHRLKM